MTRTISLLWLLFGAYLCVEVIFCIFFHYYLVPRANQRKNSTTYRDYHDCQNRHLIVKRVLDRIVSLATSSDHCHQSNCSGDLEKKKQKQQQQQLQIRHAVSNFLQQWFYQQESLSSSTTIKVGNSITSETELTYGHSSGNASSFASVVDIVPETNGEERKPSSSSLPFSINGVSPNGCPNNDNNSSCKYWEIPGLFKENASEFFAWALFGKHLVDLHPEEARELDACCTEVQKIGLTFRTAESSSCSSLSMQKKPRRFTLENLNSMHRPLALYLAVAFLKRLVGVILRVVFGFERVVSRHGLVGWYRPSSRDFSMKKTSQNEEEALLPLLFFHGIAPAGFVGYLPTVLAGLASDGRAVFLFENPSISCHLDFRVLTEQETCQGVDEIVKRCLGNTTAPVALVGHSFGSCPMTWLLHHKSFRSRIRQMVLLNPVTILLSEPDVVVNFLYSTEKKQDYKMIRMLASSELFTEYSLRRHFSWYNSELWLEDVPGNVSVLIALSETDEIINSAKVKQYAEMHMAKKQQQHQQPNVQLIYWTGVGHAACVYSSEKWQQLKQAMLVQELERFRQSHCR